MIILGAGGASRAITVDLAFACSAAFESWNTTFSIPKETDILVNATSIGLYPNIDSKADIDYDTICPDMLVCDVIPNPPRTLFLEEAMKRGAKTLDGLGMLVNQGAIGFQLWTGQEAPVDVMP